MGLGYDVKTYSVGQINITFAAQPISKGTGASGYAEDTFCEIEQDGPDLLSFKSADGSVVFSATNEPLSIVRIYLAQTSPSNAIFTAQRQLFRKGPPGSGITTLSVTDLNGASFFESGACVVDGPPKVTYARGAKERIWRIVCAKVEQADGGN